MRAIPSNELNQKVIALSREAKLHLSSMIAFFEGNTKDQIIQSTSSPVVMQLVGEIYAARIAETQVYFSFGSDSGGEYLLILDVTEARRQPMAANYFAVKNPKTNSSLNPQFNSSINPRFNSSINPRFNSSINPRFNSSINPRFNSSINPRFNSSINPRFNPAYGGPFLYSLTLDQEGFLVRANDTVSIIFDMNGEFSGFTVLHETGIVLTFDTNSEWTGYFVPSGQDPLLRFDASGEWTGIVV